MTHHFPPGRIVVAIDFGAASSAAVTFAGRIATRFGSAILALHAETVDVPPYFTREQMDRLDQEVQASRQRAEDELRRFVAARTTAPFDVRVVERPAAEAVLDAAAAGDLVVMGTHGRRGPSRWWLGAVAERVVRDAPVPVLVVHEDQSGSLAGAAALNPTLLRGADEAPATTRAWADALASALNGTVQQGPSIDRCANDSVTGSSVLVVSLPARPSNRSVHEGVIALARNCTVPVLFVPAGS
jgi:nucleotide-binding universal stress UspA family protein